MGFMTLLARKINPDKNQPQLRAPTYERKVSTKSPVRLVQTVSPSGSSSNIHGGQVASKLGSKDTKPRQYPSSPLSQASFSTESAAPAPVILGFRGDDAPSRPVTSQPPEASQRSQLRLSQLVAPRPRASLTGTQSPVLKTTVTSKAPSHRPQSSISSSKLARSIRTDGSQRGYVDLLDAQSEFKPADFYTRVKAAGTRDYGEDVADRNLGVNGCDLDSQVVQDFYAVRPKTSRRASMLDQRRPFSSWNRPANFFEEDESNVYQPQVTKQSSIDSALWSKSLNSSHQALFGHGNAPPVLSAASLQKNRAVQRQAYNNMISSSAGTYSTPSLADIEILQEQQRLLNRKMKGRSLQVSIREANGLVSAWDTTSPESEDGSVDLMAYPSPITDRPSTSGGIPRRTSGTSKRGSHALSRFEQSEDGPRFAVNNQPILSPQPTSFRLSASLASSAFTTSNKRPTTTHSSHSVRRSQQPDFETHNTVPDLSNLPHHLKEKARNFKEDWHDDLTDRDSAPSPFIKTSRSRSQSRENMREIYSRNSATTPRPRSQSGDPEEHTPGRTNSIRHWSMTSTAPTTSSSSSATYGRPHSRHTTNTSIDLSTTGPPSTVDTVGKVPGQKSDSKQILAALQSPLFNIDDYVSSDDDSFIASQAERSASEEDLLFNSGYGKMGIQLPGLEDAFSAPAPIALVRSPRLSAPRQSEDFRRAYGEPPLMAKLALRQMASDDSLDSNQGQRRRLSSGASEAGLRKSNSREEPNPASSPAKRAETKRMSALLGSSAAGYTHHGNGALGSNSLLYNPRPNPHLGHGSNVGGQVIEEERFEKVDVATAIRLRKEAKSKKRASMMSIAAQTRGRGLVKTISIESRKNSNVQEANVKALRQKAVASVNGRTNAASDFANLPELVEDAGKDHEHAVMSDDE